MRIYVEGEMQKDRLTRTPVDRVRGIRHRETEIQGD